jgi:hypothetical protein
MAERLKVKKILTPGIWLDQNDELHVSISDILDDLGWPHDDEHKTLVERQVQDFMIENFPGVRFVAMGACPNCGIGDGEKHKPDCELA